MAGSGPLATMRGTIVSDETWIGPTPKWMHRTQRPSRGSGIHPPTQKVGVVAVEADPFVHVVPKLAVTADRHPTSQGTGAPEHRPAPHRTGIHRGQGFPLWR